MRELLFKGLARYEGDGNPDGWVIGFPDPEDEFIYGISRKYECKTYIYIKKGTVCQYIGKADKFGTRIFENDIVMPIAKKHLLYKIVYDLKKSAFMLEDKNGETHWIYEGERYVVAGNIFSDEDMWERYRSNKK